MKIKTSELIGVALDWAVAKCEGLTPRFFTEDEAYRTDVMRQTLKHGDYVVVLRPNNRLTPVAKYAGYNDGVCWKDTYAPSTDWSKGGPIIEREKMEMHPAGTVWSSDINRNYQNYGSTPLIAAMRCYVASKLGDEVDVPEELAE